MADTNTGGAAFPSKRIRANGEDGCGMYAFDEGMTLRDYFAAKAMQGICVNAGRNGYELDRQEQMAAGAYLLADAMLEARKA